MKSPILTEISIRLSKLGWSPRGVIEIYIIGNIDESKILKIKSLVTQENSDVNGELIP